MIDYGILSAVRAELMKSEQLKRVYLSIPPAAEDPFVLLELEEITTNLRLSGKAVQAKVCFKAKITSRLHGNRESFEMAEHVQQALDGRIMRCTNGCTAIFKLTSTARHSPSDGKPRFVEQFYEAVVRG